MYIHIQVTLESFNAWKISFDEEMRQLQLAALHRSLGGSAAVARQDLLDEALHNRLYVCTVCMYCMYVVYVCVCIYVCVHICVCVTYAASLTISAVTMPLCIFKLTLPRSVSICMYVSDELCDSLMSFHERTYQLYIDLSMYVCMYVDILLI